MDELRLCSACDRHVRRDETTCPFCGGALAGPPPGRRRLPARRSRAALVAIGVASAAAAFAGCGDDSSPPEDAGDIATPYGAPPMRAGFLV